MKTCAYCKSADNVDDANYCTVCGSQFLAGRKQLISERLIMLGGELRLLTAIFVNFVGFEKLPSLAEYKKIMVFLREALNSIEDVIRSFDGTSNKILPDLRVLGIFGAPRAHHDDIVRTIRCAFEIQSQWQKQKLLNKELESINIAIGINTGRAFFGYVMGEFLTVIGDTINTTARLAEICPPSEILISDATARRAFEYVVTEDFGERMVKGKKERIKTYLLKGLKEDALFLRVLQLPVFGRVDELRRLTALAQGLANDRLIITVINGQMGIGKTRVKEEFEKQLAKDGQYNCYEAQCAADVQSAYYPFKFFLKNYFSIADAEKQDAAQAKVQRIGSQLGLSPQDIKGLSNLLFGDLPRISTEELRAVEEEMRTAVRNLLRQECKKRPMVVIFEEFNRVDSMTKELINYLAVELENTPLMVLLVNPPRDYVARIPVGVEELNLMPLSYEDVRSLVAFLLGDVDVKLVDFIFRSAGGNPMFTIEAIRNTRRTNMIKEVSGRWFLEKEQRLAFLDDLYGVVMATIDSLPSNDRLIVDHASVLGYSFNCRILEELLDNRDISDRLDFLVGEGYFVISKGETDPVLVFRHNLLKDAAYSVLPVRKRKELHQRVGGLIERVYANRLPDFYEDIGYHYAYGENWKKAAYYNKLSGDKAKNMFAIDQAFTFYNSALKIRKEWQSQVPDELAREISLSLTDLYEVTGNIQKMKETAQEGLESARQAGVLRDELQFMERLGYAYIMANRYHDAEEVFLTSIQKCDEQNQDLNTMLNAHLGFAYAGKYEYEKSMLYYNISWNIARGHSIHNGEVACLYNLAHLHKDLGNYEQALEYLDYGIEMFSKTGEIRRIVQFRGLAADIHCLIGNFEKARDLYLDIYAAAEMIGNIDNVIRSSARLALLFSSAEDRVESMKYLEAVDKKIGLFARENMLAEIDLHKALTFINLGDQVKAVEFLKNALRIAQKFNQKDIECESLIMLSRYEQGQEEHLIRQALEIAETIKLPPLIARSMCQLAVASHRSGDDDKSRYYGSRSLVIFNDIKSKLGPENQKSYLAKQEYRQLLEV
jgi:adenylate cyclase